MAKSSGATHANSTATAPRRRSFFTLVFWPIGPGIANGLAAGDSQPAANTDPPPVWPPAASRQPLALTARWFINSPGVECRTALKGWARMMRLLGRALLLVSHEILGG